MVGSHYLYEMTTFHMILLSLHDVCLHHKTSLDILSEYSASEDDDMTDAEFEEATKGL